MELSPQTSASGDLNTSHLNRSCDFASHNHSMQRVCADWEVPFKQPCPLTPSILLQCASPQLSGSRQGVSEQCPGRIMQKMLKSVFERSSVWMQLQPVEVHLISIQPFAKFIMWRSFQKHFVFIILLSKFPIIHIYYKRTHFPSVYKTVNLKGQYFNAVKVKTTEYSIFCTDLRYL